MAFIKRIEVLKNCPTKIINHNLITKKDLEGIHFAIIDCLKQYNLEDSDNFILEFVEISKRLKTTAGRCDWTYGDQKVFKIKLAYNNYKEFGYESMIKTLRHEMAHLIEVMLYGKSGHSDRFKVICVKLGGHMNATMAGERYKDNASTDYCRSTTKYSYTYNCECGTVFGRKRRITHPNTLRATCRKCGTMVRNMKEIKL